MTRSLGAVLLLLSAHVALAQGVGAPPISQSPGGVGVTGSGATTLAFPASPFTFTFPSASSTLLSTNGATVLSTANTNPSGTTSTSGVMVGLGTICKITPVSSTRVYFQIQGTLNNSVAGDGAFANLRFGTGAAPANAASPTGTLISGNVGMTADSGASAQYPFTVNGIATGLTPGTALWFDLDIFAFTGGTATAANIGCSAFEM